ncbi:hypothetical protein [Frigoribacterium sp. VKM Ac-2836]|uniref:hypothetical protein n=1 Tax=Frigoribacterium sp. VKM Ac-2836 TaxID=2739014 RepID=UPI0015651BC4|nr:hypothetical protein [Frigoribacterium sp. VKM Ac-2836]NRD27315.1 hypothetical protein [Frigoribacterium sp. VKM Ac-2836]
MDDETVTGRSSRLPFVFGGAALIYTYFAVASIVGAGTSVGVGLVATVVATALYGLSTLVWIALVVVAVSSARRTRRGAPLDQASMRVIGLAPPAGGAVLLAAAYVARMNGQPFVGGFEAMVITTVALVVLSQAFPALGFGPTAPGQRQSSGGGGASS